MKIIEIVKEKRVLKTKEELEKDLSQCSNDMQRVFVSREKYIKRKEPVYIVELTTKELQLVSFYLELENRKPITNVEIEAKLEKEKL